MPYSILFLPSVVIVGIQSDRVSLPTNPPLSFDDYIRDTICPPLHQILYKQHTENRPLMMQ